MVAVEVQYRCAVRFSLCIVCVRGGVCVGSVVIVLRVAFSSSSWVLVLCVCVLLLLLLLLLLLVLVVR